ncbi:MAG TPA: prepilin-type N-terminal cleavage/methylation domain-containing protein [Candidatus Polarisedimenticolia bacterium]|nr:prepilin-type N-terminal cleavage/methylation domain-containing protein [Candidatus Polarisedimenticolia bacterium]
MRRDRRGRRGEAGYSLSEVLVVVVIVALGALVAVPNVGAFYRAYRIRTASDQLVSHLRTARQIAVSQRLPVTFTINPSPANSYTFSYTIPGQPTTTQTFSLAKEISVTNTPSGALIFTMNQNGTVANPTTPDDQSPSANFVELTRNIGEGTTDRYTICLLAAGKVSARFTR